MPNFSYFSIFLKLQYLLYEMKPLRYDNFNPPPPRRHTHTHTHRFKLIISDHCHMSLNWEDFSFSIITGFFFNC